MQVRQADYAQPAALEAAFQGVSKLLLISSSEVGQRAPQHAAVIAAAQKAGVKLLAYTSILRADSSPLGLAAEHAPASSRRLHVISRKAGLVVSEASVSVPSYRAWLRDAAESSAVQSTLGFGPLPGYDAAAVQWEHGSQQASHRVRVALSPLLNYTVGTEIGLFDHSLALQARTSVPLWTGAEAYADLVQRLDNSSLMEPGAAFANLFLSEDRGLDLHFPLTGQRIPLTRGTAVVFDTGQPHAVIERGSQGFDAADFATECDCTQLFLTWELPIVHAGVAQALQVQVDTAPAVALGLDEEQVWVNGEPGTVCPASGRWCAAVLA